MAQIIDGKAVSAQVKAQVAQEVEVLKAQGIVPGLAVVIVGDDPASRIYVNNKKKACQTVGIYSVVRPGSRIERSQRDQRYSRTVPLAQGARRGGFGGDH